MRALALLARIATFVASVAVFLPGCGASHAPSLSASAADSGAFVERMEYDEMTASEEESVSFDDGAPAPMQASLSPAAAKMGGGEGAQPPADAGALENGSAAQVPSQEESPGVRRPLLIYSADLGLGVFRVEQKLDAIEKMATDAGGYLVSRGQERVTVRVPVVDFEKTVEAIVQMGDVHRREIHARDVTSEYTDLQIRLKNALAMRQRLEELLQKAVDVKEALKVEEQLGRIAEQIEMMKGRLKMLRELTSFSTISVEFSERSAPIDSRVELPFEFLDELGLGTLLNL